MSEVSGDFPCRKKRRSSIHVIDATDASSSAPLKDWNVSNVSASPWNAPISSDSGTNGKMYKVYKTVFESRDAAAKNFEDAKLTLPTEHINTLYRVYSILVAGYWTVIRVKRKGRWFDSSGCWSLGECKNAITTLKPPQNCHRLISWCYGMHALDARHF